MAFQLPLMSDPQPPSAGIGLKPAHYRGVLALRTPGFWVEVHPENYMTPGGPRHQWLEAVRKVHPLSLHGVGLSLGGLDRPDRAHLRALRLLIDRYAPFQVSEHLAWCSHKGEHFGDLLPLPYTQEALERFCAHVNETQDTLGRTILDFYGYFDKFERFQDWYREWGGWIVFAGGFSLIPYKVITIASGSVNLDLATFTVVSVISRGARFLLVAALLWRFGPPIRAFIERWIGPLTLACVFL